MTNIITKNLNENYSPKEFISLKEASKYFPIHFLFHLLHKIPHFNLGGNIYFEKKHILIKKRPL